MRLSNYEFAVIQNVIDDVLQYRYKKVISTYAASSA
jgi:hypothetical protein